MELSLIVTGMHLSKEFGYSVNEIIEDGFKIEKRVEMNPKEDTGFSMAQSVGNGINEISKALKEINPDIFLVLGDRIEPLAGTITAAYMNIPIAHIHGGDSARAGLDESVRHAITKFSHIHFPATKKSAERIIKMGENPKNVFIVGAPGLDAIFTTNFLSKAELEKKFNIDLSKPLIIMLQHSVTTEIEKAGKQVQETLEAIKELGYQTIIIYPNSDAGGREIIEQIKKYENLNFIKIYKNLVHDEYLSLLRNASVLVGNSSSGIIESASFKLPVVNIGTRQEGRERSSNVIDAPHDKKLIVKAIEKALLDRSFRNRVKKCKNIYGDGKTGERIAKILNEIKIDKKLLQKKISY
jgi:UDP-N-acetylglucosamine 2-epimerase (non-hydrolysing)/GDP/UDP-N,N'-diacetylbacillosamine 2-epimerase (hydrolysing)